MTNHAKLLGEAFDALSKNDQRTYSKCKRMTVHALGFGRNGEVEETTNGNLTECKNIPGACGCIHAEIRLLEKLPNPEFVSTTHSPCLDCAKALVEAGVERVFSYAFYRKSDGIKYLLDHGVDFRF